MAAKKEPSKAVAKAEFNLSTIAELGDWENAIGFLQSQGVEVYNVQDVEEYLGDGFTYVEKNALVNVPIIILRVDRRISPSYEVPFSTVWGMTSTNKRVKFTDFGTGIHEELENLKNHGRSPVGMVLGKGLMGSEYDACDSCGRSVARCDCDEPGKKIKATTYYLAL